MVAGKTSLQASQDSEQSGVLTNDFITSDEVGIIMELLYGMKIYSQFRPVQQPQSCPPNHKQPNQESQTAPFIIRQVQFFKI